jgi:hypothetical protein
MLVACGARAGEVQPTPVDVAPQLSQAEGATPEVSVLADGSGLEAVFASPVERIVAPTVVDAVLGPAPAGSANLGPDGYWSDDFEVDLEPGTIVRLTLTSPAFDATIALDEPSGAAWLYNDDGIELGTNARLQFSPRVAGLHRIHVSSYAPGEQGAYSLSVAVIDPEKIGVVIAPPGEATTTIRYGGGGPGDPGAAASFFFEAMAGERLTIDAISGDLDPVATLYFPNGQTAVNDDGGIVEGDMDDLDSRISVVAPVDGTYHLAVDDYDGAIGGAMTARVAVLPPVYVDADGGPPDVGFAGAGGTGRVLGVFAGISDYPDDGDLYGCADDARLLAEAFDTRALTRAGDRVVLTDERATTDGLTKALENVADEATEDDVVVIFFSGHGSRTDSDEGEIEELDGLDDTIVLHDAEMTDDALMALIEPIDAGTIILALDSCQSGGFARDFVTEPGRIGIFSSDEDILSDTAEPWGAGGYLSWYLRRAVAGLGDSRPSDGSLSAGELADFLVAGFDESSDLMSPVGSIDPRQRLVLDRGSVQWGELLWVYPRNADGSLPSSPIAGPAPTPVGTTIITAPATCE